MRTPVRWGQVGKAINRYPVLRHVSTDDMKALQGTLPPRGDGERETRRLSGAFISVARLLWAEKVVEPLTDGEAFHSHLVTLAGALAQLERHGKSADTAGRRQRLTAWLWSATVSRYPSRLKRPDALAADVDALRAWATGGAVPAVVEQSRDAPIQAEHLLALRSRKDPVFRAVLAQLYQRNVRDLRTGEPVEVALHFDEPPQIDHIFAKAWCVTKYDPLVVDSIVNKTPLSPYTNRRKSAAAPSHVLADIEQISSALMAREMLSAHCISPEAMRADDFDAHMRHRSSALAGLLETAVDRDIPRCCGWA